MLNLEKGVYGYFNILNISYSDNMAKCIYLKSDDSNIFLKYIDNGKIKKYYKYNYNCFFMRVIRKLRLDGKMVWGDWYKTIDKFDLVILGENYYSFNISRYIKKKNKHCRLIVYFWNCINDGYKEILEDKNIDEFWTFDKNDSNSYKMKYNPQFYTKNVKIEDKNAQKKYDIVFLGRAKGRKEQILNLENEFKRKGLNYNIRIVENEKDLVKYDDYLDWLSKSKSILDITCNNQVGLTLRCMESIFLEKKLITNNKEIKKYNFYNPNNIFILDEDNMDNIETFLNSPYEKVDQEIIEYYDFESWLKRFYTNNIGEEYEQSNK